MQDLARKQVEMGAGMVDLNIGRRKKDGHEVMPWMVDIMHEAVPGTGLSLDTTNAAAVEAGLKRCKELGTPMEHLYLDPLALTVNGMQEHAMETINVVHMFKMMLDPLPMTTIGLSNVSNTTPHEGRSLLNRIFLVMLMAAGLDSAIADPLDEKQNEVIRIVEQRDDSMPMGKLLLTLYDETAAMESLEPDDVDMDDADQVAIFKTVQVLENKTIYAASYLEI